MERPFLAEDGSDANIPSDSISQRCSFAPLSSVRPALEDQDLVDLNISKKIGPLWQRLKESFTFMPWEVRIW